MSPPPHAVTACKGCWCEAEERPLCCRQQHHIPNSTWSIAAAELGPAVSSIELARFLNEHGKAIFRVLGTCMYPVMRPGDRLHIQPAVAQDIQDGDIAVFRRHGILIGHRAISKGQDDKGPYIITRADRASGGDDGPSYDRDILGVIRFIERRGRLHKPEHATNNFLERAGHAGRLLLMAVMRFVRMLMLWTIGAVQGTRLYRFAAQSWLKAPGRRVDYTIQAALNIHPLPTFFRKYTPSQLDAFTLGDTGSAHWSITAHIDGAPAAMLSFFRCPPSCCYAGWWLSEAQTRIRYRATGIQEQLFDRAKQILAGWKVTSLRMSLIEDTDAMNDWQARGFKRKSDCPEYGCGRAAPGTCHCNILEATL